MSANLTRLYQLSASSEHSLYFFLQIGWLTSLRAVQCIWNYLNTVKGFNSLRVRALNQDALENLFGMVRAGCGSGDNPTTVQFAASLKTQILNGLTNQGLSGTNCEEDEHILLSNLTAFLQVDDLQHAEEMETAGRSDNSEQCNKLDELGIRIANAVNVGQTETLSVAYVSGFIARKMLEHLKCSYCEELLLSTADSSHNLFINFKEWSDSTSNLRYPSENLVVAVGHGITLLEDILNNAGGIINVTKKVSESLKEVINFSWLICPAHKNIIIDSIVIAICKIGISWWCKRRMQQHRQLKKDSRETRKKLSKFKH